MDLDYVAVHDKCYKGLLPFGQRCEMAHGWVVSEVDVKSDLYALNCKCVSCVICSITWLQRILFKMPSMNACMR